jgi:hypothetical protein
MSAEPSRTVREAPLPIALRRFEERTRALSLDAQMVECVDLLQLPEVLIADLHDSIEEIRGDKDEDRSVFVRSSEGRDRSAFFYPSRELFVNGDGCSFTCLATDVDFVDDGVFSSPLWDTEAALHGAIDYASVTCEAMPFPMLGFAQRSESESAYPLLLRGLASVIELLRPRRLDLLEREVYRGLLGGAPCFDVCLVLWDDDETVTARGPLCELARDLAELLKGALLRDPGFPPILRDIVCLRMNNKRFDGRLRFVWRV